MKRHSTRQTKFLNANGQVTIEYILLSVMIVGVVGFVLREFNDNEVMKSFAQRPWNKIRVMIEYGHWSKRPTLQNNKPNHPNERQLSLKPDGIDNA